ncbi:MAG: hypothetical protein Kow0074_14260 [Candidatus Zixiibacteriota bacterium]
MLNAEREAATAVDDRDERIRDLEIELERLSAEYDGLADMGAMLASILNLEEVLGALMEMSLRAVGGQVGAIVLQTPEGLTPKISYGLDDRVLPRIRWGGQPIVTRTVQSGEGVRLAPYQGSPIAIDGLVLQIDSVVSQPIRGKDDVVGCVVIVNKLTGGNFTERESDLLAKLVSFASVAVENARLLAESLEKQRLEQELSLAADVQRTLVPQAQLNVCGATVDSLYIPARRVGGDYFDVLPGPGESFFLAIGDVSSKGVPAALLMTAARSVVRAAARRTGSVADIVNEINRVVCDDLTEQKEMFITFFLALIDPQAKTITYSNAGHLPPLLRRVHDGRIDQLGQGGVFLGQFDDFQYIESTVSYQPGDRLLGYTDGIIEAANKKGELFGRKRLEEFLKTYGEASPSEFLQRLRRSLEADYAHADYIDDVTAVFVQLGKVGS